MLRIGRAQWSRWVSSAIAVGVVATALCGCTPSPPGPTGPTPATQTPPWQPPPQIEAQGAVDRSQVGGEGLQVVTAYPGTPTDVGTSDGRFKHSVSKVAAQLVCVKDREGKIRALIIAVPGTAAKQQGDLTIDAASTAASLVFMTPGILSTAPSEANGRLEEIQKLSGFQPLVDEVRAHVSTDALPTLVQREAVSAKLQSCIQEWLQQYGKVPEGGKALAIQSSYWFAVTEKDSSNPEMTVLKLENRSWRYASVDRRDFRGEQEKGITRVAKAMEGAVPIGWGALLTQTINKPTVLDDTVDFSNASGATTSEYWVVGPGWASVPVTVSPPAGLDLQAKDAWGESLLYYVCFPFLDLLTGTLGAAEEAGKVAGIVWDKINAKVSLDALRESNDEASRLRNGIDAVGAIISAGIATGAFVGAGVISAEAATAIETGLTAVSVGFGAANVFALVINWALVPPVLKATVATGIAPGNRPPQITSLTADRSDVGPGGTSRVTCTAQDPDGDALTYSWQVNGGTIAGSGTPVTWTAPTAAGAYTITCTVSDGKDGSDSKSVNVTVTSTTVEVK